MHTDAVSAGMADCSRLQSHPQDILVWLVFVRMSIQRIGIDCLEAASAYEKGVVTGNPAHTGRRTGIWSDGKRTGYFTVQCDQWIVHGWGSILVSDDSKRPETCAVFKRKSGSSRAGIDCVYDQNRSMYDASAISGFSGSEPMGEGDEAFCRDECKKISYGSRQCFSGNIDFIFHRQLRIPVN